MLPAGDAAVEWGASGWWVAELLAESPWLLFSWVLWVIGSITLHELGHGWSAIAHGDRTPIELGRMTWNPLVHMGGASLLVFAIVGIAWGAMPVNPARMRGKRADAVVAAAGPAMNLGLAVAALLVASLLRGYGESMNETLFSRAVEFFEMGAYLNFALVALNLLPIPPLDGSVILADFVEPYRRWISHPHALAVGALIVLLVLALGFQHVAGALYALRDSIEDRIVSVLPGADVALTDREKVWMRESRQEFERFFSEQLESGGMTEEEAALLRELMERGGFEGG